MTASPPAPIARIAGTGRFLPPRVVTNAELETMVETSDEWIRTRTGIRERRLADGEMGAAAMGAGAAMAAGKPRRIAVAAVATAWANATRSALPWLFTTTAVSPTMQAPL